MEDDQLKTHPLDTIWLTGNQMAVRQLKANPTMLLPLSIVGLKEPSFTPTKKSRHIFKAPPRPYKSVSADFNHISV